MVYPIRASSGEALQNAVFNYLNLNRHKFDESGRFLRKADERDYVPSQLAEYVASPSAVTGSDDTDLNDADNADESEEGGNILPPLASTKRRRRFSTWTCMKKYDAEQGRCWDKWGKESGYPYWMYYACLDRARNRALHCTELGDYRKGIDVWDWKDMAMEDPSKANQSVPTPPTSDSRVTTSDSPDVPVIVPPMVAPRSDMNAWAKAQRLWQPRYEGSITANDNFPGRRTPILSPRPRGPMIRATPGMGFGGGMGGGGGKPRFVPRFPGDPVGGKRMIIY